MADLLTGTPLSSTQYVSTTTDYPKWMQDAIYKQIQSAQNVANMPYQQYNLPTVAELSPLQQQAYQGVQANQGTWQTPLNTALTGTQGLSGQTAMTAANPYFQTAAQTTPSQVSAYMNPYQQNVMDVIATQGARNLSENLMPAVSDAFIKSGQFGSSQMGTMGQRALRDTQEAILNQQAQAAQTGYTQALGAAQSDLARQAQLGQTIGSLSAQDIQTQLAAQQQAAAMAQQMQSQGYADTAALEAAGTAQQQQAQQQLTAAYGQFQEQRDYPKTQMDWLSAQVRGLTPYTVQGQSSTTTGTGQSYSPSVLAQLGSAYSAYRGLTTKP